MSRVTVCGSYQSFSSQLHSRTGNLFKLRNILLKGKQSCKDGYVNHPGGQVSKVFRTFPIKWNFKGLCNKESLSHKLQFTNAFDMM
jgi:hypothetical protein